VAIRTSPPHATGTPGDRRERDHSPRRTLFLLLGALLLIVAGFAIDAHRPGRAPAATSDQGDAALYRAIDARMAHGESYYAAAATEQRARGFPLRPFVAVRMPTRAWLVRLVGASWTLHLLQLLGAAVVFGSALRLRDVARSRPLWVAASLIAALSVASLINPVIALWPELWAGLLIALSLACRTDRRWHAGVALGLVAVLFRELALAYLAAMAAAALYDRRRGEALAWVAAAVLAVCAIAAHAVAVHAVVLPGDPASQGWVRIGGWGFDLSMARATTLLALAPWPVTAVIAPLALFGWAAAPDGYARRVALAFAGWLLPFLVIGRPENSYWGLLMAPLWLAGLPLALPALREACVNNPWRRAR
jgi:hypothetical protein